MGLGSDIVLLGLLSLLLILLSTIETAAGQISDVSLQALRSNSKSDPRAAFLDRIAEHWDRFRISLLLGILTGVVGIVVLAVQTATILELAGAELYGFGGGLTVSFCLRLLLPRLIVRNKPESILLSLMPVFKPYYRLTLVLVVPLTKLFALIEDGAPEEEQSEEDSFEETMHDLQAFIDVGAEEGIIEESEGLMIQSIVELGDTNVHEVMTPRGQIVAIPTHATAVEARDLIVAAKHSRLPVYSDELDNIEGVLYVRDLLVAWANDHDNEPVTSLMRPAYFVPEVKSVADLLEEMRKSNIQIAIVIDEYGTVSGIVTIEDLLEEIVGEIEDEDAEPADESEIVIANDGSTLVKGSTEIRKVELHFDTELEADDFTTVAGLIINELGHLPSPGERLEYRGFDIEVVEVDNSRINLLKLRPVASPESTPEHEPTSTE